METDDLVGVELKQMENFHGIIVKREVKSIFLGIMIVFFILNIFIWERDAGKSQNFFSPFCNDYNIFCWINMDRK